MQTKNCIIIHWCPSDNKDPSYNKHWLPRAKQQLVKNNIPTLTPSMPSPWAPEYEKFKEEFEKYPVNENSILIGHSCGCAFLVRWLGNNKNKIAKLILVAPWKINDEWDEKRELFYTYDIDPSIKERVDEIIMFTSDNEEAAGKESLEIFKKILGGKIIELKNHGHYTKGDMWTDEFPELIHAVLS